MRFDAATATPSVFRDKWFLKSHNPFMPLKATAGNGTARRKPTSASITGVVPTIRENDCGLGQNKIHKEALNG
jgi:hypothetical protein